MIKASTENLSDMVLPSFLSLNNLQPTRRFTFAGQDGSAVVTLDFGATPHTVRINPDLSMDDAARLFWNATARIIGAPEPFPDR